MFLEYKIRFTNIISKNVSIICTVLVRTLYGAEKQSISAVREQIKIYKK